LGIFELSLAFFGKKEDTAFLRSFSRREWFCGMILHSSWFIVFPSQGGCVLLSMKAFKLSVMFADVNPVLKGKGVEDDLSKAPAADDDCSAIICLYPVVPKTD
jgi:hypothetical protein